MHQCFLCKLDFGRRSSLKTHLTTNAKNGLPRCLKLWKAFLPGDFKAQIVPFYARNGPLPIVAAGMLLSSRGDIGVSADGLSACAVNAKFQKVHGKLKNVDAKKINALHKRIRWLEAKDVPEKTLVADAKKIYALHTRIRRLEALLPEKQTKRKTFSDLVERSERRRVDALILENVEDSLTDTVAKFHVALKRVTTDKDLAWVLRMVLDHGVEKIRHLVESALSNVDRLEKSI